MDQLTTTQLQRVEPGIYDLANGYPEHYEDNDCALEHLGGGGRMRRLEEIMRDIVKHRPLFDPNYTELDLFKSPVATIWDDEPIPFDPKEEERKLVKAYWQMAAPETSAGVHNVIVNRQPIFSQSASYAMDLIASVLRMRGVQTVGLIDPSLDIFAELFQKKNGLKVEPISEAELHYTGACRLPRDFPSNYKKRYERDKTTAIVIISPNNPTGNYIAKEELIELATYCKRKNIPLIVDSVFRAYHPRPYDDIAVLEKSGCTYAVIGDTGKAVPTLLLKAGFIICSKDWHQEISNMAEIFGQVPLSQLVTLRKSIIDLDINGFRSLKPTISQNRSILASESGKWPGIRLETCFSHVPFGLLWLPPDQPSAKVTQKLRDEARVAVIDAAHFFRAGDEVSALRVSLARPTDYFCVAILKMSAVLAKK
jgi:aspartate/methionine/tyrosine aminotransferase